MTISLSDNNPRISYTVNAGATQTSFTVPFEFFDIADLNVYVDGTQKSATTHYTVSSGGSGSTGTIALNVTGASGGSTVVITRDIDLARTTDFPTSGSFNIAALNTELDKITAQFADRKDDVDRSLRLQDSDTAASMELPLKDTRKGTVLGFNATTGVPEAGPAIADVSTLSAITSDIATLADIEDGTDATDAIQTVAGISSNVTTVAGISGNVTSVAGNASNINAVAGNATNINTVAGKDSEITSVAAKASLITSDFVSDLNTLAVTDVINDINTLATSDIVSDLNTLATSDIVSDLNTLATSDIVSDINTLATSDIVTDLNLLATSDFVADLNTMATTTNVNNLGTVAGAVSNVNTVAGISSNVSTVAGISSDVTAVAGDATDIGTVATSISNVNTVAGIASNVTTVANDGTDIGTVAGISSNVTTVAGIASNVTATASNSSNINTVAGSITNVNSVGGAIANVNTVATNLSSINDFADKYRIGSSDPSSSNDEGDLFYNTTSNTLKVYTGSAWEGGVTAGSGFLALTGGQLTGNVTFSGSQTVDGRDLSADGAKLDGIEASADVTDATNVAAAGALMTSGGTVTGNVSFGDSDKVILGADTDAEIFHNGTHLVIRETNTSGNMLVRGDSIFLESSDGSEQYATLNANGAVVLKYDNATKLSTTSSGVSVTGTLAATALTGDGSGLTGVEAFPAGTRMLFHQSSAPTGWAKDTSSHNNKALRVVTGSVSSGGSNSFTTAFGSRTVSVSGTTGNTNASISGSGTTGNTSLSLAQLPSHRHGVSITDTVANIGTGTSGGNSVASYSGHGANMGHTSSSFSAKFSQYQGSGNSHNHSFSFSGSSNHNHSFSASGTADINVQYVDIIIAQKS